MGSIGVNRLARVIQGRAKEMEQGCPIIEFGSINANMSLTTNFYNVPVPENDYIVCRLVKGLLSPGDRVLVAWAGDDPVVVDIILKG